MRGVLAPAGPVAQTITEMAWVLIAGTGVVFCLVMVALVWALRRRHRAASNAADRAATLWWIGGAGFVLPLAVLGGNTAVEEALYLTHHASKVTLIHRRDNFRAEKILQDRLFKNPKVSVLWDHAVQEITGETKPAPLVTGVTVKNVKTGAEQSIKTDGVFIAIGHSPNTELFKGKLAMDSEGYLVTRPDSTATDIDGVYAAGDVQDKIFRQAVTAAGTGCMAALEAEKYLATLETTVAKAAE